MRNREKVLSEFDSNESRKLSDTSEWTQLWYIRKNQKLLLEVLLDIRDNQLRGKNEPTR